jgi:glutathione synthase/RimK-type ligase-like ATP-grasp enzyme
VIALVSCDRYPMLGPDDRHLLTALDEAGLAWEIRRWDDPATVWNGYDAVIMRAPWDYYVRPAEFEAWLDARRRDGSRVLNPLDAIAWNMHKSYLRDLEAAGIRVVETEWVEDASHVAAALARRSWDHAVVKPVVSAGAWQTVSVRPGEVPADLAPGPLMVQPFLDAVVGEGEWSLVYTAGRFSHALLKRPAPGDFRVQEKHGGTVRPAEPSESLLGDAERVLASAPGGLLYARVDGVRDGDRLVLLELEIFEPVLYFGTAPGSAERFVAALRDRL